MRRLSVRLDSGPSRFSSQAWALPAGLAVLVLLLEAAWPSCGAAMPFRSRMRVQMGSLTEITVAEPDYTPETVSRAFDVIERLDRLLSTYRDDSEVMQLARDGRLRASPETLDIIQRSRELSIRSGGGFNPLVAPLVALWKEGGRTNRVPPPETIAQAKLLLDWQDVAVNPGTSEVVFARPGMALDFGAIGKGYAVDRAAESLQRDGIEIALVASGGSSHRLLGHPPGGCWEIGIRHPEDPEQTVAWLRLGAAGVGSHSIHGQGVEIGGKRYGHILDPGTGYPAAPADPLWSVTLIGTEATTTDALGAAVVVLGARQGMALVRGIPGLQALFVLRAADGTPYFDSTGGLRQNGWFEGLPLFTIAGDRNCRRSISAGAPGRSSGIGMGS